MGARCLNPTTWRMDGVDNYASSFPGISGYNWVMNNPNVFIDPDGNQATTYTGVPDNSGDPGFNNGFANVSFRAAGYSLSYFSFTGKANGRYHLRHRASETETGRIPDYRGERNVKILYDDYWEWVPGEEVTGPSVSGIKSIMFQPVRANTGRTSVRPQALTASMISTTLDYYNIKNALYAKIDYNTYDIGKVSSTMGAVTKTIGRTALAANLYNYGSFVGHGGKIISPETALLAGDVVAYNVGFKSGLGFFWTLGWEMGKAAGRYKNSIEKRWSPGGLDGLISTPE